MKDWLKSVLRKITGRDANVRRNQFNQLLKETYAGKDLIFDLAQIESTRPDGSQSYFLRGTQRIYTLAPDLTNDGGHLNEFGRRAAVRELLSLLSNVHTETATSAPLAELTASGRN
jgi:hypothetical protein